uniref:AT-rich interaction domain 5B n=1 Tax=Tetraodon nigroviridis TaxID=99883 RepID=H3CPV3_TETNG
FPPQWVGSSCGLHGPYIFYKAFKFSRDGRSRILALGDFFFVRCHPEEPICVALQLLWEERTSKQLLSSSKLYFLPEDTPQGRAVTHGEHEVIAVSEKVTVRLEDLVKWTVPDFSGWAHSLKAEPLKQSVLRELGTNGRREALHRYRESTLTSGLNFKDVQREKAQLGQEDDGCKVLVLSYPQYCRYRSVLARLREQPSALLIDHTVLALGGIAALGGNTRILYCRDTFDHPALLKNESVCDEFAPNLKGRPRKKKLSISQRRESQGSTAGAASDPCTPESKTTTKVKCKTLPNGKITPASKHKAGGISRKSSTSEESRAEEQAFLVDLYKYMKDRDTPIERIPFLGFKQINLWTMFQAAQKLGGYELITVRRQWKHVYDELGGNPSSTSAATCTRRHYERLLLPYERHLKGEQDKPLPLPKPRKQDGVQDKAPSAKVKAVGAKKLKNASKSEMKNDRGEAAKEQEPSQVSGASCHASLCLVPECPCSTRVCVYEPALTVPFLRAGLQRDGGEDGRRRQTGHAPARRAHPNRGRGVAPDLEEGGVLCARAAVAALPQRADRPDWRQISEVLQAKLSSEQHTEGHFIPKNLYLPHRWEQNKTSGQEPSSRAKDSTQGHGGRVGKVLPMCKQEECIDLSSDSFPEKEDSGVAKESIQSSAYSKAGQVVMSPLAKKKLLSQPPLPAAAPSLAVLPPDRRENEKRKAEEEVAGQRRGCVSDSVPEAAPVFRPSVIQHAQSSRPQQGPARAPAEKGHPGELPEGYVCRTGHGVRPQLNPPWQPYLPRAHAQETADKGGEALLEDPGAPARTYAGDCYSSPHLHSLYRQTESCLGQERMVGFLNGERREPYGRDREGQAFVCGGLEQEGLAYRSHFSERTQTQAERREAEDEPRDYTVPKPLSQRVSSFSKPSFCSPPYPILSQGLESRPKACRVPPLTVSPPKASPSEALQPFPCSPKASGDASLSSPARAAKRPLVEVDGEEVPERKVRVVTPIPGRRVRRSDPEELKPAEPAHAVHLNNHLPEGHPASTYPPHHAAPYYTGIYPPCSLVSPGAQDGLQQHPGLQYLKSQSAVSPLVPPLALHSMMLHRQLLASHPSPHHFYGHPGGAALYGDLLHHLYPLSPLPPPQLSSVHPSTRL